MAPSTGTGATGGLDYANATSDAELREILTNLSDVPDPYTLTGVTEVKRMNEVTPVVTDPTPQMPVELIDADGYEVTVTDTSRILALDLFGTYTKTLAGLGMRDRIIGRTVSSDEPSLKDVPLVTKGGHTINVEAVLSLKPTLMIVDHSVGPANAINQVRDAGVTVVVMEPKHTIDSIGEDIMNLAMVVGLPQAGKKLAEQAQKDLDADREAITKLVPDKPMRMAFLYARGTGGVFYILGEGSGAQDLIEGIGGIDLAAENNLAKASPANAEALAKLDPDVFIMMTEGLKSTGGIDGLLKRPGVAQTTAGKMRRIVAIPDGQSLAFGPDTGELLLRAAMAMYAPQDKQEQ
ncbi:heme/hemin ABC transporter substrate-binding protein [Corynebacterium mendelii]|uniref:heme/hemin ABC transporter substrate-binding protein n=1 Tax=Corynebacterium mendelii TaxID=2765362 RepID=UPI00366E701F